MTKPKKDPIKTANLQSSLVDLELFLATNNDPAQRFEAIDREIRHVESVVTGWPKLAKYCQMVEDEKLFKQGGYKNMTAWLQQAAPKSERSIRDYLALHKNLSPDFTDEEQAAMPVESAKFVAKNVTSREHRKNPAVRNAAKKERADCARDIKAAIPGLHLEDYHHIAFPDSAWEGTIQPVCEWWKKNHPEENEIETPAIIEFVMNDYPAALQRIAALEKALQDLKAELV